MVKHLQKFLDLLLINGQASIEYFADGEIVENSEEILIKITSSIEDSESEIISFTVKPPGLFIKADPEEISLSDSSNIEVFWYNEMDSLELVPDDYAFQVEIIEGAQYGDIFDPISNESGDLFNEIYQGFSFKSDSLMEIDSAAVYIRVSTLVFGGGFIGKSDGETNVDKNKTIAMNKSETFNSDKGENIKSPNIVTKSNEAVWVSEIYGIIRIIVNNGIMIEILEPKATNSVSYIISSEPRMPNIITRARLKNYNGGSVGFTFNFSIKYIEEQETPNRVINDLFEGIVEVQNSEIAEWTIPWNGLFRGGAIDTISIEAVADNIKYTKSINNPFTITGSNPPSQEIKDGLTVQQQVIIYKESYPKWKHFNSNGLPIWGAPHGYGLMQLDNPRATDQQVWNWNENIEAGIDLLDAKYNRGLGFPSRLRNRAGRDKPLCFRNVTDFTTEEQIWKEAFQRYNGNENWRWVPDDERDPNSNGHWEQIVYDNQYGVDAWNLYSNIISGNPPQDW